MTTVLGIETATTRLSVAVVRDGAAVASISFESDRRHVEELVPTIEVLCRWARTPLTEVDAFAVDVGPGLFTGMRVGIATAQALALAHGVGVVPVGSGEAVAHPHGRFSGPVVAVVDARRGEVFRSVHRRGAQVEAPTCTAPAALADELSSLAPCLVVGDGAARHRAVLGAVPGVEVDPSPAGAEAVAVLGAERLHEAVDPAEVRAVYLRDADAKPNFEVAR